MDFNELKNSTLMNFGSQETIWFYAFRVYARFSEKLTFLTPSSKSNLPPQHRYPPVPPSPKFFYPPPPPSPQPFYFPLRLEIDASASLTHGYFQEAHVHISEAIITD